MTTKSIIIQRISATIQFILGFILGISLIAGVSAGLVFAYYQRMSVLPKKPVFSEITTSLESEDGDSESATAIEPLESNTTPEETGETVLEEAAPATEPELPPDTYYAVVTWPQGLSLRNEPSLNAGRIGGIGFEEKIIILEDSADGKWQRVRLPWSQKEGWVKGGNTKRASY